MLEAARARARARLATLRGAGERLTQVDALTARRILDEEMQRAGAELAEDLARRATDTVDTAGLTAGRLLVELGAVDGLDDVTARRQAFEVGTAQRAALDLALATAGLLVMPLHGLVSQGVTAAQLADAMTVGRGSAFQAQANRWRTMADVYIGRAHNDALLAVAEDAEDRAERLGEALGLHKRDVELFDPRRNHPISRVLDGQVQPVRRLFRAPAADVARWAVTLRKSAGGIFWRLQDGAYVGMTLPAHFGERGAVVPWLPAWNP